MLARLPRDTIFGRVPGMIVNARLIFALVPNAGKALRTTFQRDDVIFRLTFLLSLRWSSEKSLLLASLSSSSEDSSSVERWL